MRPEIDRKARRAQPDAAAAARGCGGPELRASRGHLDALVALLADDSPAILAQVRGEFERLGKTALPDLRRAARNGTAPVRARARQILLDRDRRMAVRRIIRYAMRDEHDLERAIFLLDAHHSPGRDLRPYRKALDAMGCELKRRLQRLESGEERAAALVEYLSEEIGFSGAVEDYHHPDNIHISRTIERRVGMPLTLCAIYAFVARRAGMTAGLLPFPGHVLLSVRENGQRTILDPFGEGKVISRRSCDEYLARNGFPHDERWFKEASDTAMFLRHVLNLIKSCRGSGRSGDARQLENVLRVLADHPLQLLQPN